jgi:hypothetical protein
MGKKADKRKARRKRADKAERKHIKEARASFQRAHQLISTIMLVKELGTIMRRQATPAPSSKPQTEASKTDPAQSPVPPPAE